MSQVNLARRHWQGIALAALAAYAAALQWQVASLRSDISGMEGSLHNASDEQAATDTDHQRATAALAERVEAIEGGKPHFRAPPADPAPAAPNPFLDRK